MLGNGSEAGQLFADEQAALRRVATLVAREEPAEVVFTTVAREAGALLGAQTATTYRFGDVDAVAVGSWSESGVRGVEVGRRVPLDGETAVPTVHRTGRATRLVDRGGELHGAFAHYVRDLGIRSTAAAPVHVDGRLWGCLTASRADTSMPEGAERQLAEFADLLSQSISSHESRRLLQEERDFANAVVDLSQAFICVFDRDGRIVRFNRASEEATGFSAAQLEGTDARLSIVPPEHHELFGEILERAFAKEQSHPMRGFWLTRDGGRRTVEFSNRPLLDADGNVRFLISTGLDVTEREAATAEITRLAAEQGALRRVATLVARMPTPEEVFAAVAEEAGRLLGAESAATIRFVPEGAETVGRWNSGHSEAFAVGTVVPLADSDGLTAVVARTGAPARVEDYTAVRGEAAAMMRAAGYRSAVAAPIVVQGATWGLLLAASAAEEPLGSDAERRLTDFTELVALALESAQAREDLTASRARIVAAGDAARRRFERNLHDGAQQRLVTLSLQLRLVEARLVDDPAAARELVGLAADELRHALEELRELARGLHPALLAERGLGPALEALAARAPFPVELSLGIDERLADAAEAALFYVASESLANAAKHAGCSYAGVKVGRSDDGVWIEIVDDGCGGADPAGSGLLGLGDRVAAHGGRLVVTSPPGFGTVVRAELPAAAAVRAVTSPAA